MNHGIVATNKGNILYTKCPECDLVYTIHRFGRFLIAFETIAYVRNLGFQLK